MDVAISLTEVTRSFDDRRALDGLTLHAAHGEVLALLGPNGAGKTTTVRLCNGVLRPDTGAISVCGLDPTAEGTAVRRRTGVLTEHAGLDERLTALENVEVAARLRGERPAEARRRALHELERFGMGHRSGDLVQGFSTGQRKRVALARALVHEPDVLFLDEPTAGLDPEATRDVLNELARLAAEGRTIVLCTHVLAEAGRLASTMAVLVGGRLLAHGSPDALASDLFDGSEVAIDLGGPGDDVAVAAISRIEGIRRCTRTSTGLTIVASDRRAVAAALADLAARGVPVYAAVPTPVDLEAVYFALLARQAA